MAVDRVDEGASSRAVDMRREESSWSGMQRRALAVNGAWRTGPLSPRGVEASASLVEMVEPQALDGEGRSPPGPEPRLAGLWVDEELREVLPMTLSCPGRADGLPPSFRLEVSRTAGTWLGVGAPPDVEPLSPATLPVGSTLTLEPRDEADTRRPRREVHRLDEATVRITAMPSRGVVEEPFSGLLGQPLAPDVGGTVTVERALGWTADLDLRHAGAQAHYREFLANGEVPITHHSGGVARSGRVADFTDSCAPAIELRFLRDFAWLDCERVESRQRVVEYEDGGVEVRSHARFSGGRQLFSTIVVDTDGQSLRGDHSLVLCHLSAEAVGALSALFGERHMARGRCHARLRLTEDEALRWRDLARAQVCQRTGMSVGRFEAEARTPDMAAWEGSPQLISLALARTAAEVADAAIRFQSTAPGVVACLVRLGMVLGTRTPGTLTVAPASEA